MAAGKFRAIPTQVAVRYRKGQERKVADALSVLGTLEDQRLRRILILHRAEGISSREVDALLTWLRDRGAIEFASAVLRDIERYAAGLDRRDCRSAEAGRTAADARDSQVPAWADGLQAKRLRADSVHRQGAGSLRHQHPRRGPVTLSLPGGRVRESELSRGSHSIMRCRQRGRPP